MPRIGPHSLVWDGAVGIPGTDSNWHRRNLWAALEGGECPESQRIRQVVAAALAAAYSNDVLHATQRRPEEPAPVTPVGPMAPNPNSGAVCLSNPPSR